MIFKELYNYAKIFHPTHCNTSMKILYNGLYTFSYGTDYDSLAKNKSFFSFFIISLTVTSLKFGSAVVLMWELRSWFPTGVEGERTWKDRRSMCY